MRKSSVFLKGVYDGLPIGLGYLSVSFGFGIMAVRLGLSVLAAVGISLTNLTSAGQVAGVTVIAAAGSITELIFTQLIINLRYSLMAVSLTQKLDGSFGTFHRMAAAFGITDEIYAVASSKQEKLTPVYMYGLIFLPVIGWTSGTLLGAVAGEILPGLISEAMGIMLYGMFIAIIIPPAKKNLKILFCIALAVLLSLVFYYLLPAVSSGFAVIISAVVSSCVAAVLFPVSEGENC